MGERYYLLLFAVTVLSLSELSGCASYCKTHYDCMSAMTTTVSFDLATEGTQTASVAPGEKFIVVANNKAPYYKYSANFSTITQKVSAIPTPGGTGNAQANSLVKSLQDRVPTTAKDVKKILNLTGTSYNRIMKNLTDVETKFPGNEIVQSTIKTAKASICPTLDSYNSLITKLTNSRLDESAISMLQQEAGIFTSSSDTVACATQINNINMIVNKTTLTSQYGFTTLPGQNITLSIFRGPLSSSGTGSVPKMWSLNILTGPAGEWRINYGFAIIRNNDQLYTAQSTSTIRRSNKSSDWNFDALPVLMFSYYDPKYDARGWDWGPTAGFGLDFTNPTVLLGLQLNYHQNLFVSVGGVINKQERLKSTYSNGQVLSTMVQDADLVEQKFGASYFLSVTLRFDTNPFASSSSSQKTSNPVPSTSSGT